MKPLYDFYCGSNTTEEVKEVFKFLFKNNVRDGEYITKFEDKIKQFTRSKYAHSFAAGRHALYSILQALQIKEGDEVIIQAFTCVVVPNAILYTGAIPVYVDIESLFFNMDIRKLKEKITDRTRAIIVQHTFGYVANIKAIKAIAGNIPVIEDCAHVFKFLEGDVGFISTDHTKVINTVVGGVAFTNDEVLYHNLVMSGKRHIPRFRAYQLAFTFMVEVILTHPKIYRIGRHIRGVLNKFRILYFHRDENKKKKPKNYPRRMSNTQGFIGCMQMDKLVDNLKHRMEICIGSDLLRYPYLTNSIEEKEWIKKHYKKSIIIGEWFNSPVFGCKDLERVGYKNDCPIAEDISKHIINFPTHQRAVSFRGVLADLIREGKKERKKNHLKKLSKMGIRAGKAGKELRKQLLKEMK